ncbi:nucleotidyltransferase family protein [Halanaerobium saccharolyticum]|uniref:nucleotidyltransferase family protein n=1 Tax=Halanaerobium saccharolyticum TaxID=43595 RepID=UPI003FCCD037
MSEKYPLLFKDSKKEEKEERRQEALTKAKKAAKILKENYKAEKAVLFGSVLDKDRFYLRSDVDLAVFGLKDELFYKAYAEVMNILSGFEVDLLDYLDYKECCESFKKEIKERGVEL